MMQRSIDQQHRLSRIKNDTKRLLRACEVIVENI
jgi:hypothetical protein